MTRDDLGTVPENHRVWLEDREAAIPALCEALEEVEACQG